MEPTRRPEDEAQLNKTPAEQEEPEYSLEEIMNEFGGWTKREEPKTEPGETPVPSAAKNGRPKNAAGSLNAFKKKRPGKSAPPSSLSTFFPRWKPRISSILPPPACGCACC